MYVTHERYHKGHRLAVMQIIHEYECGRLSECGSRAILIHVDSMEQAKFRALFKGDQKVDKELRKLRGPDFRITVVAVRGLNVHRNYVYIAESFHSKGPNVTVECISQTLKALEKDGILGDPLVDQVDLLLDNTCSENKCNTVRLREGSLEYPGPVQFGRIRAAPLPVVRLDSAARRPLPATPPPQ